MDVGPRLVTRNLCDLRTGQADRGLSWMLEWQMRFQQWPQPSSPSLRAETQGFPLWLYVESR